MQSVQSWKTSKMMNWGHVQMLGGIIAVVGPLFTQQAFPDVPGYVFGIWGIFSAVVTYMLRIYTTKPLDIAVPEKSDIILK